MKQIIWGSIGRILAPGQKSGPDWHVRKPHFADLDLTYGSRLKPKNVDELRALALKNGTPERRLEDGFQEDVFLATISDESKDRYGDRILVDGWDIGEYRKNPVLLAFHDYESFSVGHALDIFPEKLKGEDETISRLRGMFLWSRANPEAQVLKKLYADGDMRAFSVGFIPDKFRVPGDDDERAELGLGPWGVLHEAQTLLENSAVPVPANPNAIADEFKDAIRDAIPTEEIAGLRKLGEQLSGINDEISTMLRDFLPKETKTLDLGTVKKTLAKAKASLKASEKETEELTLAELEDPNGPDFEMKTDEEELPEWADHDTDDATIATTNFAGSPRSKYGTHGSKGFKGGYAKAWRVHFSKIGGGATSAAAAGPIRGTVRRVAMIAANMKGGCAITDAEKIGARSGGNSPLPGEFASTPKDYGLSSWANPSDDKLERKDVQLTCKDLNVIKRAAVAEIKWRIAERERKEDAFRKAVKADDGTEVQTLILPKAHWDSADAAKAWVDSHDFKSDKIDETSTSYRFRQQEPSEFDESTYATICIKPNGSEPNDECQVKAVIGKKKKDAVDLDKINTSLRNIRATLTPEGDLEDVEPEGEIHDPRPSTTAKDVSTKLAEAEEEWIPLAEEDFPPFEEIDEEGREVIAGFFAYSTKIPPESFGDLLLGHHRAEDGAVVLQGVKIAMTDLLDGTNGGENIPEEDRRDVYEHLSEHFEAFGETPPEFKAVNVVGGEGTGSTEGADNPDDKKPKKEDDEEKSLKDRLLAEIRAELALDVEEKAGERKWRVVRSHKPKTAPDDTTMTRADWEKAVGENFDLRRQTSLIYDSADPKNPRSYLMPHHLAEEGTPVVWNSVRRSMRVLLSKAIGGDIPEAVRRRAYFHLRTHYEQFDKEAPAFRSIEQLASLGRFLKETAALITEGAEDSRETAELILDFVWLGYQKASDEAYEIQALSFPISTWDRGEADAYATSNGFDSSRVEEKDGYLIYEQRDAADFVKLADRTLEDPEADDVKVVAGRVKSETGLLFKKLSDLETFVKEGFAELRDGLTGDRKKKKVASFVESVVQDRTEGDTFDAILEASNKALESAKRIGSLNVNGDQ